jgi:hypothetical protein
MGFPTAIAEKALLDCGRSCCICHKFCGSKIELHHIIQVAEGGQDSYENCIPLCLDCHAEVKAYNPKHPKGRKYTNSELRGHRDRWYEKVNNDSYLIVHPDWIELDRKLFLKIRALLPSAEGSIYFLRRNSSHGSPYDPKVHDGSREYVLQCENPEFEFIDADLEIRRSQLTDGIKNFLNELDGVAFYHKTKWPGMMMIYPDIKYTNPDTYKQAIKDVSKAANTVCSAYDDLVRLGRRKLAVE